MNTKSLFRISCALLVGAMATGLASPTRAFAQTPGQCDAPDNCQFDCSNAGDPWTISGDGDDGVWVKVTAKPVKDESGFPALQWWNDAPFPPASWPPMRITARWISGSSTITEQKEVEASGTCTAGNSSRTGSSPPFSGAPHIRCHDQAASTTNFLCDGFGGVWDRITDGSNARCVIEAIYGIDMAAEISFGGSIYCWQNITVEPLNQYNEFGDLQAVEDCDGQLEPWAFQNTGGITYDCTSSVQGNRAGGAAGLNITLNYVYDPN